MTNREWLNTLSNSDLALFISVFIPRIVSHYTDSVGDLIEWFELEYNPNDSLIQLFNIQVNCLKKRRIK